MTQIGELASVNATDEKNDDNCPFCYKKWHKFATKQANATAKVTSKPKQLDCDVLAVKGNWKHTTARHHLISAIQCYAQVRRLVRMAAMVKYDINDPPNGIGLPTVANNITYTVNGVGPQKFGKFDDDEKVEIAFNVMRQAKAQWHVGHHAFDVEIPDDWADEVDDSLLGHTVSYDQSVIKELLKILDAWVDAEWCAEDEDKSNDLIKDMDQVSELIKNKLKMFATDQPSSSAPFFVSYLAFRYAEQQSNLKKRKQDADEDAMEDDDDPPPVLPARKKLKV